MNFINKLFHKSNQEGKVGGMEDFMTLIRVYFQAAIAANAGISNLSMFPDLRIFKTTMHVPTLNNKLGLGEKNHCKKMMKELYKMDDSFFKEIDKSIHNHCRRLQDVNPYLLQFQNFTQEIMMLVSNLMKYKLRIPSIFKNTLRTMVEQQVNDIFDKNDWKDVSVIKSVADVRKYNNHLGFSRAWASEFVYQLVMLAKKEPKPSSGEDEKSSNKQA